MDYSEKVILEKKNLLKGGDENVMYYSVDRLYDAPVVYFNRNMDTCSALVIIYKTNQIQLFQSFIAGKENNIGNIDNKVIGIWVHVKDHNCCEIILEFEKSPLLIFPNNECEQMLLIYTQGLNFCQLCMFDSRIKGNAFTTVTKRQNTGLYIANLISPIIEPYMEGKESLEFLRSEETNSEQI